MKPVSAGMTGTWGGTAPRVRRKRTNKEGQAISYMALHNAKHQGWVIVVWDGATVPTCEPAHTLLFKHAGQRAFKPEII